MTTPYGALPGDWDHLSLGLGLTADLLPVVSDPNTPISPQSAMTALGKTPSTLNSKGEAVGVAGWTQKTTTDVEVARWGKNDKLGICIQTRAVRAIDIDVEDSEVVNNILEAVVAHLGISLPKRMRSNSNKCLLAFTLPGDMPKRVIKLQSGIIEFLATGQQFVAVGTHPSGARYEWVGGLPTEIPEITLAQFESLWQHLAQLFGTSGSVSASPSKAKVLNEALAKDEVATYLLANGWVKSTERDGRLHIICPFEHEHTTPSAVSATTYFPANTGGYAQGHFDCRHAHCEHRSDEDFKHAVGVPYSDPFDDFTDETAAEPQGAPASPQRFAVVHAHDFAVLKHTQWIIKGVLPQAELAVVYGESGSGKSFFVNDLAYSIAQGTPWRNHRVTKGNVVVIAAEGASGMRGRLIAYSNHSGIATSDLRIGVIPDAPNFMQVQDVKDVIQAIKAYGEVSVVVVDTFAQVMAGSNENAGEDVGKALSHCRQIHKHTGAMVLLVHHAGKDASKGARGWSGLRAAADVEIEVSRCDNDRVATVTKMKDGEDGLEFGFKLRTVTIGHDDEDMEPITSCVVEEAAAVAKKIVATKHSAGAVEKRLLHAISDMIALGGDSVEGMLVCDRVASDMVQTTKADTRRTKVLEGLQNLADAGEVIYKGGFISLPTVLNG